MPKKIGTGNEIARKLMRNQGWSSADLTAAFIARDPLDAISSQIADYWAGVNQTTLLKICQGILADNIANDGGDMVKNVATDASGDAVDGELFGSDVLIDAAQTMGDAKGSLRAIAVHSVIHARMQKIGALVENYDPETGRLLYESFQGIPAHDRKIIILAASLSVAPAVGHTITAEGRDWQIVALTRDPAKATWEVQGR